VARLRDNIVANYAGQAWMVLMGLAFVPWYLRLLGPEAFGLVGFMLSLQALSQLFDLGISAAVNRELARRAHAAGDARDVRDLVRTCEALVWPIALAIGLALWIASPAIAGRWLQPGALGAATTQSAVALMAVAVAALWPTSFYSGALYGLERQGLLNAVNAVFATLRFAGVLVVLQLLGPGVEVFIGWHALVGAAQSLTLALLAWRALPAGAPAHVRWPVLRGTKRFAGGMFAIGALSLVLSQLDRLALSTLRPLAELGYYSLAASLAAGLGRLVLPMFNALYPRFSRLVATGERADLVRLYHLSNQWLVAVVAAVAAMLIAFGQDVVWLWTGDAAVAAQVAVPLALMVLGSAFNGMINLPYALQLANGATRLTLAANAIAFVFAVPLGWLAIARYGMTGAASIWLAINAGYFLVTAPLAHRRWLAGESRAWYLHDLLPPVLAASAVVATARALVPPLPRDAGGLAMLAGVSFAVLLASTLATPAGRAALRRRRAALDSAA
jgi:O-antigen/teichoic acid export membrane protein